MHEFKPPLLQLYEYERSVHVFACVCVLYVVCECACACVRVCACVCVYCVCVHTCWPYFAPSSALSYWCVAAAIDVVDKIPIKFCW